MFRNVGRQEERGLRHKKQLVREKEKNAMNTKSEAERERQLLNLPIDALADIVEIAMVKALSYTVFKRLSREFRANVSGGTSQVVTVLLHDQEVQVRGLAVIYLRGSRIGRLSLYALLSSNGRAKGEREKPAPVSLS